MISERLVVSKLEVYLEVLELLNIGTNHSTDYSLCRLSDEGTVEEALGGYFSSCYTSLTPKQPASAWQIRLGPPLADWPGELSRITTHWFFEQEFSPKVYDAWVQTNLIERFLELLETEVEVKELREVFVTPPMFYDLVWQDLLLSGTSGRWLLHFGFAD